MKASLVVESRELTLDELSAAMGRRPDSGYDRGSLAPVSRAPRQWASWAMNLVWPPGLHGGTEGLAAAIESLEPRLAERAASLAERGCEVVISVRQELADRPESVGLNLTPAAVRWMAAAGAALAVDQYVDSENEPP